MERCEEDLGKEKYSTCACHVLTTMFKVWAPKHTPYFTVRCGYGLVSCRSHAVSTKLPHLFFQVNSLSQEHS